MACSQTRGWRPPAGKRRSRIDDELIFSPHVYVFSLETAHEPIDGDTFHFSPALAGRHLYRPQRPVAHLVGWLVVVHL